MKRDMTKLTESMTVPVRYDMTREETRDLMMMAQEGKAFDAIATAFKYGFLLGQRYEKNTHAPKKADGE